MNKQSGFTIIELMIAGFIGIFILTGLLNLFIATNRSVTLSDSLSQNQETGRFAMDYLTRFVRRAGYSEDFTVDMPALYMETNTITDTISCAGIHADVCAINNPDVEPVTLIGDRLSIPMYIGGDLGDEIRSCTGMVIGGPANGPQKIVNVFWVSAAEATARELRCRTFSRDLNDWLDQPTTIINNIERLEFQAGIATDEDPFASRYVSVNTIEDDPTINLNHIRSIRISVLTTSQDDLEDKKQSQFRKRIYSLLDAPTFTIEDSNIRNIFSNTVELPNMINK